MLNPLATVVVGRFKHEDAIMADYHFSDLEAKEIVKTIEYALDYYPTGEEDDGSVNDTIVLTATATREDADDVTITHEIDLSKYPDLFDDDEDETDGDEVVAMYDAQEGLSAKFEQMMATVALTEDETELTVVISKKGNDGLSGEDETEFKFSDYSKSKEAAE